MSLLLDALKRAEQEKLARQGAQPATVQPAPRSESAPRSPPASPASAPASPAPKTALELEAIESAKSAATQAAPASGPGERSAAQVVFAAKREEPARAGSSRAPLIAGIVVVLLLLAGGGGYVWYQIQAVSSPQRPLASVRPVTPAPAPGVVQTAPPKAEPVSSPPPLAMLRPGEVPASAKKPPAREAAEQAVMDLLAESRTAPPQPPLKLTRSLQPTPTLADVTAGYDALRRGDVPAAKDRYQAALGIDSSNLDALLGLATAEARLGQRESAARHYRRALQIDPRNATALAGLAALADFSRPEALEAQLRGDLQRYPQSAALHFTLGNLLASQSRWADAQAAFFEAHRLAPADADIAYNLAVALDQLGQPRPAAEFYARALAQSKGRGTQFERRAAEKRLAELRP